MKKIRVLSVSFDTKIRGYEIPAFRGAIIDKVGKNSLLYHNHLDDETYLYKYPLIQYKQIDQRPAIMCIEHGVDEIHKYFENRNWDIQISGRWLEMKIAKLQMNQFTMQVWDKKFDYSIRNWVALNQDNYKHYLTLEYLSDRVVFLEKTLKANILSFAKGIEWNVDTPVELHIHNIDRINTVNLKGKRVLGFDISFTSNVFLPNYIGLGKSVSLGYGIICKPKRKNEQIKTLNIVEEQKI